MDDMKKERVDFGSKLGMILATAGSAVGLGNIWRFPVEAGDNGGAAFIIIYILCVLALGIPLMVAEFVVGRAAHTNTAHAYGRLGGNRFWRQTGRLGVLTGWLIMGYYIVVAGWTLNYLLKASTLLPGTSEAIAAMSDTSYWEHYFSDFVSHPVLPIMYAIVFALSSHFVIVRGVKKGIEQFSKVLMPVLFILLLLLTISSFFTEGAAAGLAFLFRPDFSQVTLHTILAAMGQAFFSMSIGMGCLCTYASYFPKETNLTRTALNVGAIDSLVAVMAGIIIFPAVFSTGLRPDAGASLVFIALPHVFQEAFGALPWLGYAVSVMFYALLVLATLTSVISLHEVPTAWITESFHCSRHTAATIVTIVCLSVGTLCSLSMGAWSHLTLLGRNLFDVFDWTASCILLPLGGALTTFFAGWILDKHTLRKELTNDGEVSYRRVRWLIWLLKYFAPFVISLILLNGLM